MLVNNKKPMLVGLCGRSGSGKGYVSRLFAHYGIPAVDTDAVYRDLTSPADTMSPCMCGLVECFGKEVALSDNSLNRAYLRNLVFSGDGNLLLKLNNITHKYILEETMNRVRALYEDGFDTVIIDAPLLFESEFNKICDHIVCVVAPEDISIRRITKRDSISVDDAKRRLSSQISSDELARLSDDVIANDDTDRVKTEVEILANKLLQRSRQSK